MTVIKAPNSIELRDKRLKTIFLAGSIEMDKAIDWQLQCEQELFTQFNLLNPRRASWDSSWKQELENQEFRKQVEWELTSLEEADQVIMFFASGTKSPISLLEFGLYARSNKLLVVCEEGFWRKGNVDVVCQKYKVKQFDSLGQLIQYLKDEK